jgi:DNA replication protein DnaC
MRPVRQTISRHSLGVMGIPEKFQNLTIEDFQDFGNEEIHQVKDFFKGYISSLSKNPLHKIGGLFIYGSNGVGKTFLSSVTLKEAYRLRYTIRRVSFSEYVSLYTRVWEYKGAERELIEGDFYSSYKAVEFLVIEEIGKEIDTKITSPILEDLLRFREDKSLVTIICTNATPKLIEERYGISVMSLIKGNFTSVKIVGKDKRQQSYDESKGVYL